MPATTAILDGTAPRAHALLELGSRSVRRIVTSIVFALAALFAGAPDASACEHADGGHKTHEPANNAAAHASHAAVVASTDSHHDQNATHSGVTFDDRAPGECGCDDSSYPVGAASAAVANPKPQRIFALIAFTPAVVRPPALASHDLIEVKPPGHLGSDFASLFARNHRLLI